MFHMTPFVAHFKSFFTPKPVAKPIITVDERAVIATIRSYMSHLAHLCTIHKANYELQWKVKRQSIAFRSAEEQNQALQAEHTSVRCKVLMGFSKHNNFCLDNGVPLSSEWDALREDVIALPSGI